MGMSGFINILRILDSFQLKTGEKVTVWSPRLCHPHIFPVVPKAYKESGPTPVVPVIPAWSPKSLAHTL